MDAEHDLLLAGAAVVDGNEVEPGALWQVKVVDVAGHQVRVDDDVFIRHALVEYQVSAIGAADPGVGRLQRLVELEVLVVVWAVEAEVC